jgi:tetratricopeptide (TPR) repeat protein
MIHPAKWLLPALAILPAIAQHHPQPAPGKGPEKPVVLYKGLGAWKHPIATKIPDAQRFFDQGLALLYGFNRYEALRSFRKTAELDPHSAMAYWGMAMAQGPYINMDGDPSFDLPGACSAIDAGKKIAAAPERESAYLAAVSTWCPEYKPDAYIAAMRQLTSRYPDDLDARTIFAESLMIPVRWHWYSSAGTAAPGVAEAERTLEEVLRRWPDHPGANHYYIHAVESSPTPERAIASSQRLMALVPSAGHLVHMPGHIWLVLGDWGMAATVNERAAQVDREYFAASNVGAGSYTPYYIHNVHFILYARMMQGNQVEALRAAETIAHESASMAERMPEMADMFTPVTLFAYARFNQWDAVLKLPRPGEKLKASTAMWHYVRALAMAARGASAGAALERDAFQEQTTEIPAGMPWGQSKTGDILSIAREIIDARLAASPAESIPHWKRAVEIQDTLAYDEPPDWYYPVRESLGAVLLLDGKAAEAEQVFREGVRRSPRNGRMLFGLLESLKAQNKTDGAASVRREFEANWPKYAAALRLKDL